MNGLNSYDPDFRCKVTDSKDQLKTKQKEVQSRQTASNKNLKHFFTVQNHPQKILPAN